jgi:response regulator RpfG family c-di-GMP phosphodiesterase
MKKKRLLIIDDSEIDREILKNMLGSRYEIIEAENGYDGLDLILDAETQVDGLLLDISMPMLDGFQILQLLQDVQVEGLPVIIISAESTEMNVLKSIPYNISDFICKPFEAEVILSRVEAMFQKPAERKEKAEPGKAPSKGDTKGAKAGKNAETAAKPEKPEAAAKNTGAAKPEKPEKPKAAEKDTGETKSEKPKASKTGKARARSEAAGTADLVRNPSWEEAEEAGLSRKDTLLTTEETIEMESYIEKLAEVYKSYLAGRGEEDGHYRRTSRLVEILLMEYVLIMRDTSLSRERIHIAGEAAYFCDIGEMTVPDALLAQRDPEEALYRQHTTAGSRMVSLNQASACRYFTQICSDLCLHHHERYDGNGFPQKKGGDEISLYAQACAVALKFDAIFSTRPEQSESQFDFSFNEMVVDSGEFSQEMLGCLRSSRLEILFYYRSLSSGA